MTVQHVSISILKVLWVLLTKILVLKSFIYLFSKRNSIEST
jgi:hypothetical protein